MPPGIYVHHKQDEIERFWRYVDIKDDKECWAWTASLVKGYGSFKTTKSRYAHRFSYWLHHPATFDLSDESVHILHSCDNPTCVSPYHLSAGNPRLNSNDKVSRGRAKGCNTGKSGEQTNNHTLKLSQVIAIKEAQKKHKRGDDGRLAVLYGISRETISSIRLGKTWKEV